MRLRIFFFVLLLLASVAVHAQISDTLPPEQSDSTVAAEEEQAETHYVPLKERRKAEHDSTRKAIMDKLLIGGTFGLQFGNVTVINISPSVGYFVTKKLVPGVGLVYQYSNWKGYPGDSHIFGARGFLMYFIWKGLFAQMEYEWLNYNFQNDPRRLNSHGLYLGGGYAQFFGSNMYASFTILYNVLYSQGNTPYASPLQFRIGFGF